MLLLIVYIFTDTPPTNNYVTVSSPKPEAELSDGEIMTTELSDIVTQFMQNVKLQHIVSV